MSYKKILVIAPHPDDESLGCGGTVSKYVSSGAAAKVVFLSSGERGGHGLSVQETISKRESEARTACRILGIDNFDFWRLPDGGIEATKSHIKMLADLLDEYRPDLLLSPFSDDMHRDHVNAAAALRIALDSCLWQPPVCLMYEVWTPIQKIDHVEDISDYIETKVRAIQAHQSQCAVVGFAEGFRGLARYRGEMHSWPGGHYAEVFSHLVFCETRDP